MEDDRLMQTSDPEPSPATPETYRYDAFISYRHVEPDRGWAKWLHGALETYRVPKQLVAKGYPNPTLVEVPLTGLSFSFSFVPETNS